MPASDLRSANYEYHGLSGHQIAAGSGGCARL